jgi:D-sedoheptulose 7-phosphate isomerase
MSWIDGQLQESASLVAWLRDAERASGTIARIISLLADGFVEGRRVLACGNGGSMCDAMHFAGELSGRYRRDRPALAAQAIGDPAHLTCVANDWGFDHVFARGVEAWGQAGDRLVLFSTSGNSRNIVLAAEAARAKGLTVVGLLGRDGGAVRPLCDEAVVVPGRDSGRIQEVHIKIVHLLVEGIERQLVPQNYSDT